MFPWQKKEVFLTCSMTDYVHAKEILAANRISYNVKVMPDWKSESSRRAFKPGMVNSENYRQYYLYVKKQDAERALYLLGSMPRSNQ